MSRKRGKDGRTARATACSLARNIGRAEATASEYVDFLCDLYIVDRVAGWDAPVRAKSRVRTKPKYYFCDPSIPAVLLGMSAGRMVDDAQTLGLLFETLVMRDLSVYMEANPLGVSEAVRYYRDSDGLEVDAVLELSDGRWGSIEIKMANAKVESAAASLKRLSAKVAANPCARNPAPAFMAVITAGGDVAYKRPDGVYVVPICTLGP